MTGPESDPSTYTWIQIALVIFFIVFVLLVIAALVGRRDRFKHAASIPLDDSFESEGTSR